MSQKVWRTFNHFYVMRPESYRILGGYYAVQGHSRANRKLICDFLLVINTKLPPILHCFRDIALDGSKIAIFVYLPCVYPLPRQRGFPGTISLKFYLDINGWPGTKWFRNITEDFSGWVGCTNVTDRQTDDRQPDLRRHMRSRSLKTIFYFVHRNDDTYWEQIMSGRPIALFFATFLDYDVTWYAKFDVRSKLFEASMWVA